MPLLVLVSLYGAYLVVRPFLHALILAVLMAALLSPIHQWLFRRLGNRRNLCAFLSVLVTAALVIGPILFLLGAAVQQGVDTFQQAQEWLKAGKLQEAWESSQVQAFLHKPFVQRIFERFQKQPGDFGFDGAELSKRLIEMSQAALKFGAARILPVMSGTGRLVFNFFVMLFVMFYLFRDGRRILDYCLHLSPLSRTQEEILIERIRSVTRAVLIGALVTAACQGFAASIAFVIVGIPALFWGIMYAFASLIPIVGGTVIWIPAVGYLLLTGHIWQGVFLAAWCMAVVGTIDNFLRPVLMRGVTGMSTVVLFMAIIGGLQLFGPVGLIYGPLIFGLCAVCLAIYEIENREFLTAQDAR